VKRLLLALGVALVSACGREGGEQVLDEAAVSQLGPSMTREELIARLGPPASEAQYRALGEKVLSWHYVEFGNRRMYFNAHFDEQDRLQRYSRTPDPAAG
jgi:outer membrane protein assembly factor BamE (lipoprotein component of BamABCDE complex)